MSRPCTKVPPLSKDALRIVNAALEEIEDYLKSLIESGCLIDGDNNPIRETLEPCYVDDVTRLEDLVVELRSLTGWGAA